MFSFVWANVIGLFQDGFTALHLAVECGKPQVVQMLLGYGAQVEFKGGKAS
jgi:ankyrin repeat protein